MNHHDTLRQALVDAVQASGAPGAVAYVGDLNQTYFHGAAGLQQRMPEQIPATAETIYDLASLTKVIAATTATLKLRDAGVLDLDQPIVEFLPIPAFRALTFRHLLTHTAGLAAYFSYYLQYDNALDMIQHFSMSALRDEPGRRRLYSDVGFIILGQTLELAAKSPLDVYCRKEIFEPLGMDSTGFNPSRELEERCAATELCAWRKTVVRGKVHDENAYAIGGVSGHAGLFSTAGDLALFCRALLNGTVLSESTVDEMARLGQVPAYPWQGLGWLIDPWSTEAQGSLPARNAIGHTGWTGTSMWVDRDAGFFSIMLGNTCHPSRDTRNNRRFRQTFYSRVSDAFYSDRCAAHTGIDGVLRAEFAPLHKGRFALLTNRAAVDMLGRPILDVLDLDPGLELHCLYGPEHGLDVHAEAGEKVASRSGAVPVISLYGDRTAPTKAELDEIRMFVVDLPDVGARYYTYMATMKSCIEACARARKPVLVLDRPNPLGGHILEGPVARNLNPMVCCAPIPVRHGMTMGELAQYFGEQISPRPEIEILPVEGWRRHLQFEACALPWVAPSPNMPRPATARLYVGTCLFEGTNLNEGRGTEIPFEIFGAPWLDPERVIAAVPEAARRGVRMSPSFYKPESIPGKASNPRFKDQLCGGVILTVEDREVCRPFTLALALIAAVRETHPQHFAFTNFFDVLTGTPRVRAGIEAGVPVMDLVSEWTAEVDAFARTRPRLYS